jgi:two-component system, chemotaxis family, response regulator Rcp1
MTDKIAKPIHILLVEDNPGDVRLTQEVLKEAKIRNTLEIAKDGVEALNLLRRMGIYAQTEQPDLILLDLNLPKKNGLEVLREIKTDPALKRIPVVILTSSQAEKDIVNSYDGYANAYVTKPVNLDQFFAVVRSIESFWLEIVKLPHNGE